MTKREVLAVERGAAEGLVHNEAGGSYMDAIFTFLMEHRDAAIALVSALVAMIGALLAARETRKQRRLIAETLRQRLDGASIKWGDEAIEALAAAEGLEHQEIHENAKADRILIAQRLSALADRGRLFFPNQDDIAEGSQKEAAFRGSRPPILDAMIFAYKELISVQDGDMINADFLRRCRRLVVSELQEHLDPRHWDSVIERGATKHVYDYEDAKRRASALQAELLSRRENFFKVSASA